VSGEICLRRNLIFVIFPICYLDDYIKDERDEAWKRNEICAKCKPENVIGREQWEI